MDISLQKATSGHEMIWNVLECSLCNRGQDDQPHILQCHKLNEQLRTEWLAKNKIEYRDIFGDTSKQKEAIVLFSRLLKVKEKLESETNK